ncbi:hypothetical protein I2I05_15920 [Hymenobacter sp. BT683]|uniref:Uncharacterized protein n=1 Tax=Hymenobacter jeongseonensis TaxID=2791027 RepID=A0ABS0IKI8_9BACT|nr:hypothetical protein [Hymenobacter jeongseonensis]MBF9238891.1 hypothetical protein [Hymenobacter jeongseonensis]
MSAEKLAFLQNFYTDVTLYVPSEPAPAPAPEAPLPAKVPDPPQKAVVKPVREVQLPSRGYSNPSAGLERLASSYVHPQTMPEPAYPAATPSVEQPALPVAVAPIAAPLRPMVPPATEPPAVPAVPPVMLTPFTTLGSNAAGVIFLFRLPQEQFLKLHRNVFLNKMLQALGLVMADVVLVNVESDLPVALVNLRRELAATHIVAFGKNLLDTTIRNTQIYEPVLFPSLNLSYLSSATVDLVEYDVSLKKRLWPGLQRMFLG